MTDSYIGTEVADQFRIEKRIGTGGMGAVYRAAQPEMNRHVAVKILHKRYLSRHDLVSRFRREARAMSHLSHPNTARVFMYGQLSDGACYFVMEYLEGKNLAQLVRAEGALEAQRVVPIMQQVCGALDEAHRAGIIHRDLKPENIFLTSQGGIDDFPKVLDFGLAKVTEKQMRPGSLILTREGMVFGTPEFMSPEQARGEHLDGRSDIYSLGVITYELLSGKLPFEADQPIEYIKMHASGTPKRLAEARPGLNEALEAVIMRALAKKPEDRFQTAEAFADAMSRAMAGTSRPEDIRQATPAPAAPDPVPTPSQASPAPAVQQDSGIAVPSPAEGPSVASLVVLAIGIVLALLGLTLALTS